MNILREIKWKWQRMQRGFSDRDLWSFDTYLAEIISKGTERYVEKSEMDVFHDEQTLRLCKKIIEDFKEYAEFGECVSEHDLENYDFEKSDKKFKEMMANFVECFRGLWW